MGLLGRFCCEDCVMKDFLKKAHKSLSLDNFWPVSVSVLTITKFSSLNEPQSRQLENSLVSMSLGLDNFKKIEYRKVLVSTTSKKLSI